MINTEVQTRRAENKNVETQRRWSLVVLIFVIGMGATLAAIRRRRRIRIPR